MAKRPDRQPEALAVEREWSRRIAATVGAQVKRLREQRDSRMSAKQLSDVCEQLGYRVEQQVIANMENGRRTSVTIPEVMVLAQALGASPVELIFPLHRMEAIEVLPGRSVDPWAAAKWFTGDAGFPGEESSAWAPIQVLREHDQVLKDLQRERLITRQQSEFAQQLRKRLTAVYGEPPDEVDGRPVENLDEARDRLASLETELEARRHLVARLERDVADRRQRMRRWDLIPPSLGEELAYLDAEDEGR